jgi:hypothetical protein
MLSDWVIKELNRTTGLHEFIHILDEDSYRQSISFNAFFFGRKKLNWTPTRLFSAECRGDYEITVQSWKRVAELLKEPYKPPVEVHHTDLYAFYQHIGYDRKTKTWHEPTATAHSPSRSASSS